MRESSAAVFVATLGECGQVVVRALEALLARRIPIAAAHIVYLPLAADHRRLADQRLAQAFADSPAVQCLPRYRLEPLTSYATTPDASDAADHMFAAGHRLLMQLKQPGHAIHLSLAGGHDLLRMILLNAAQIYFEQSDRIWLLNDGVHNTDPLIRLPFVPWGRLLPGLPTAPATPEPVPNSDYRRQRQVWDRLTPRQRAVLQALAEGLAPQAAAERLAITLATLHTHKTIVYQECCIAWELPAGTRLDYRWLRERFATLFAA